MRILKVGRTIITMLPQPPCTHPTNNAIFITSFTYPSYHAWFILRRCQHHRLGRVVNDEMDRIWKGDVVTLYYYPGPCSEKLINTIKIC